MANLTIDNTADADLKRTITWQFDKADNLIGIINILKDFFNASVKNLWDELGAVSDISETADDYALAVWGKILGVNRPMIEVDGTQRTLSTEAYRRILVARFRLVNSCASIESYIDFVNYIFEGAVKVSQEGGMAMSFEYDTDSIPSDTDSVEYDLYAMFNQYPDLVFIYPSGVKSNAQTQEPVVGLEGQSGGYTSVVVRVYGNDGDTISSTATFTYDGNTYTAVDSYDITSVGYVDARFKASGSLYIPEGTVVSVSDNGSSYVGCNSKRSVTDFAINTMDNATIAWNR